jgi:elongation factor Ts
VWVSFGLAFFAATAYHVLFMTDAIQISATQVNDLRARTGAGLMDCKRALVETKGDVDAAIDFLRKKGLASAAKRADRTMKDGLVAATISPDSRAGAIVMVGCETDFVAKTDDFINFTKGLSAQILSAKPEDVGALESAKFGATSTSVKDTLAALIAKLGENMAIRGYSFSSADNGHYVDQYIHLGGKIGVLLTLTYTKPETVSNSEFKTLAKDICMQIAAAAPAGINRSEIPADVIAKEKEIAAEAAKGNPAAALEKIIAGKLEKFYAQNCLLEQPFVKDPEQTIKTLVEGVSKKLSDTITVKFFKRLQVGS